MNIFLEKHLSRKIEKKKKKVDEVAYFQNKTYNNNARNPFVQPRTIDSGIIYELDLRVVQFMDLKKED